MTRAALHEAAKRLAKQKDIALCTAYRILARRAAAARKKNQQQQQQTIEELEKRHLF